MNMNGLQFSPKFMQLSWSYNLQGYTPSQWLSPGSLTLYMSKLNSLLGTGAVYNDSFKKGICLKSCPPDQFEITKGFSIYHFGHFSADQRLQYFVQKVLL